MVELKKKKKPWFWGESTERRSHVLGYFSFSVLLCRMGILMVPVKFNA